MIYVSVDLHQTKQSGKGMKSVATEWYAEWSKSMKQNIRMLTLSASTFLAAALLSVNWSAQSGISISTTAANARVGRPLTPVSVAGVARRQYRRATVGTAAAVGSAAWATGYDGSTPYYERGFRRAHAAYYGGASLISGAPEAHQSNYSIKAYYAGGPWYGYSGWNDYAARNGIKCTPGLMTKLDDGLMYVCQ